MRDYGKVHTSFWASETLREVDSDAKVLALYLLTSQHTHMAGAFRLPSAYACDDLGWDSERLAKGFKTLSNAGWLRRCEKTAWVWIVKFGKFNPPDNPNQRKAVEKQLALIPEGCSFRHEAVSEEPLSNGSGNPPIPTPTPIPTQGEREGAERIPLDDGSEFPVTDALLAEFGAAYPRVDVLGELRKARAWCVANPSGRKTRRGVTRFLNSWLSRASLAMPAESKASLPGGGRRAL